MFVGLSLRVLFEDMLEGNEGLVFSILIFMIKSADIRRRMATGKVSSAHRISRYSKERKGLPIGALMIRLSQYTTSATIN